MDELISIGRYVIAAEPKEETDPARVLGRGGFATVYRATDPSLEAPVAIKVLSEKYSEDLLIRRQFMQEARTLRRIEHPRLVKVYDIGELPSGQPYFVMELVGRGSLGTRIETSPEAPTPDEVRWIADGLAEGLERAHASDVVHRDIKPHNVLLRGPELAQAPTTLRCEGDELLLGDFGMAKDLSLSMGQTDIAGGTFGYMAPEQFTEPRTVDSRADIYAASRLIASLWRVPAELVDTALWVSAVNERVPAGPAAVLIKGASTERDERHQTISEWRDELSEALRPAPNTQPMALAWEQQVAQPLTSDRGRRGRTWAVLALVLTGLVGLVALFAASSFRDSPTVQTTDIVPDAIGTGAPEPTVASQTAPLGIETPTATSTPQPSEPIAESAAIREPRPSPAPESTPSPEPELEQETTAEPEVEEEPTTEPEPTPAPSSTPKPEPTPVPAATATVAQLTPVPAGAPNRPPVAGVGADIRIGTAPVTVTFSTSETFDADFDTLTYSWDFGDGGSGSGSAPSHTYTTPGFYDVVLTVSDGAASSTAATEVTVTEPVGVTGLRIEPTGVSCHAGDPELHYDAVVTTDSPVSMVWFSVSGPPLAGNVVINFYDPAQPTAIVAAGEHRFRFKVPSSQLNPFPGDFIIYWGKPDLPLERHPIDTSLLQC